MLSKLFLLALVATVICQEVKEKGNIDDLIENVFGNEGRTDAVNEKVSENQIVKSCKTNFIYSSHVTEELVNV
jgi:hypothetical protein